MRSLGHVSPGTGNSRQPNLSNFALEYKATRQPTVNKQDKRGLGTYNSMCMYIPQHANTAVNTHVGDKNISLACRRYTYSPAFQDPRSVLNHALLYFQDATSYAHSYVWTQPTAALIHEHMTVNTCSVSRGGWLWTGYFLYQAVISTTARQQQPHCPHSKQSQATAGA
jgi:hypothetical protein